MPDGNSVPHDAQALKPQTLLRLDMFDNGYSVFDTFDRTQGQPPGWQDMPINEKTILKSDRNGKLCTVAYRKWPDSRRYRRR
jgi:hypothetical protein